MTPIRKPFDAVLKQIAYEVARPNPQVVTELGKIGRHTIEDAFQTKATGVILGNQIDAYGYGVFFNRELVLQGYLDGTKFRMDHYNKKKGKDVLGAAPDVKRRKQGRVEALHSVQAFVPDKDGYVLLIVNAMWYSTIHEAWGLPIISQALIRGAQEVARAFDVDVSIDFHDYGYNK